MLEKSQELGKLFEALAKAQGELRGVPENEKVNAGRKQYSYSSLSEVISSCRDALTKNGLAISQGIGTAPETPGAVIITTILGHSSGQYIQSTLTMQAYKQEYEKPAYKSDDPQSLGSAMTYGRRYAYLAIIGVAPGEDDDGAAGTGLTHTTPPAPTKAYGQGKSSPKPTKDEKTVPREATKPTLSEIISALPGITAKPHLNNKWKADVLPYYPEGTDEYVTLYNAFKTRGTEIEYELKSKKNKKPITPKFDAGSAEFVLFITEIAKAKTVVELTDIRLRIGETFDDETVDELDRLILDRQNIIEPPIPF